MVGVNSYVEDSAEVEEILTVDPESERQQLERLKAFKADRDNDVTHASASKELKAAAEGSENLLPPIRQALKDHASVGEVCGALREVFGEYQPEHLKRAPARGRRQRSSSVLAADADAQQRRRRAGAVKRARGRSAISTPPRLLACVKTSTRPRTPRRPARRRRAARTTASRRSRP